MHQLMIPLRLTVALALTTAMAVGVANAQQRDRAAAGECGEYKYYQKGQCADAREKPGKEWTKSVMN
jgi:hypothetical protein